MKRVALGFHMHSGWGVLVAVSQDANAVTLLDRRRIVVADPEEHGAIQPYHFTAQLKPPDQEKHLARCAASSCHLAATAIAEVIRELEGRHCRIVGAAILLASGRPLPPLTKILGAHPLIHTAEGEFFRQAVRQACGQHVGTGEADDAGKPLGNPLFQEISRRQKPHRMQTDPKY